MKKKIMIMLAFILTVLQMPVTSAQAEETNLLMNGGFETGIYTDGNGWSYEVDSWDGLSFDCKSDQQKKEGDFALHFYNGNSDTRTITFTQTVNLEAGTYELGGYFSGYNFTPELKTSVSEEKATVSSLSGWGVWDSAKQSFVVSEAGEVKVSMSLSVANEGWGDVDGLYLNKVQESETDESPEESGILKNPGFESDIWEDSSIWNPTFDSWDKVGEEEPAIKNKDGYYHSGEKSLTFYSPQENVMVVSQTVSLEAGTYTFGGFLSGGKCSPVLSVSECDETYEVSLHGWNEWDEGHVTFTIDEEKEVTVKVTVACETGGWGYLDDMYVTEGAYEEPEREPSPKVSIKPIEGLSEDFTRGVDISSIISMENAGVKYYNTQGEEEDIFKILADAGVNYIRVRVWNDPYDSDGNGYGGGNCDLATAIEIGQRAAAYNIPLLVDFHYSDFWASPGIQQRPKAWEGLSYDELKTAVYNYTKDSVREMLEEGVLVGMVQIGNETSQSFLEYKNWDEICPLLKEGLRAVKDVNPSIRTMIHFAGSASGKSVTYASALNSHKVSYDVLGLSWYAFYNHETMQQLTNSCNSIIEKYGKSIMIVENSYPYRFDDSDGHPETFGDDRYVTNQSKMKWGVSAQGQAEQVRDVIELLSNLKNGKGIGYFYWEPAWISVGDTTGLTGDAWQHQFDENKEKWLTYGCGWASEYGKDYYTTRSTVDNYWGGSSWDNQAMFTPDGQALDSINVFKYIYDGNTSEAETVNVESLEKNISFTLHLQDNLTEEQIWDSVYREQLSCKLSDGSIDDIAVDRYIEKGMNSVISSYSAGKTGTFQVYAILKDSDHTVVPLTIKITGNGDAITKITLSTTVYSYDGKAKTPAVTVTNNMGGKLVKDTDYTVTYPKARTNVGTYKITIKGKGNYSFTKYVTYKINPKKTSIRSLTKGNKSFTISWNRVTTQCRGYQVQYSTSAKFTNAKIATIKGYTYSSKTIKNLQAKKKYYVRVRTYLIVGSTKYYSGWSATKYVTTK